MDNKFKRMKVEKLELPIEFKPKIENSSLKMNNECSLNIKNAKVESRTDYKPFIENCSAVKMESTNKFIDISMKKDEDENDDDYEDEEDYDDEEEEEEDDDDDDDNDETEDEKDNIYIKYKACERSQKMYWCNICWKDFRYILHMKRHMTKVHQKEKPPLYKCEPCKLDIYTPRKFTEHFSKCQYIYLQRNVFKCAMCDKKFPLSDSCKKHEMTAHMTNQSFSCSICGKAFRKLKILRHHTLMHKEMQHVCKICGRSFRKLLDLSKHITTHDNRVPYLCFKCKVGFSEKADLKNHVKKFHRRQKIRHQ